MAGLARTSQMGPLLERERELSVLDRLIADAVSGTASVVSVEGPAGIGKTRLVAESKRLGADAGALVLSARSGELEHEFPFGVVRQLFEPPVADVGERVLRGAAAPARAIVATDAIGEEVDGAADSSFAALHGLYWLTVHLSEVSPLVLAVDDLHWCDAPSLRFLAYLTPRLDGLPIVIVCSVRSTDRGASSPLVAAVAAEPSTVVMRPGALTSSATAHLIRERLHEEPAATFSEACHRATGGNPLLLNQLLKALEAEGTRPGVDDVAVIETLGPASISHTMLLGLSRLPVEATSVAQAVAVLGDRADLTAVAALSGLDERRAGKAAAALARAEILRRDPPLGFVHPLVAAAIYRDILPGERELMHMRAAELLLRLGAPVELVAQHLLLAPAGGGDWIVHALSKAARGALRQGAPDSAVSYLSRALAEPSVGARRGELLLELGRAEVMTWGALAAEHLSEAYALMEDREERGILAQLLGRALMFRGHLDEAAELARSAAAELPEELDDLRRALEAFEFFCVLFGAGDRESLRELERHRALPLIPGVGAKMLAAIAAQAWVYDCGPSDACSELSLAALAGGELIAADNGLLANCPITNLTFADREEAVEWWDVARAEAHRRGSLFSMSSIKLWGGHTLLCRGELLDAEQSLRSCLVELDQWGLNELEAQIYVEAHLSSVLRERGDLIGARQALDRTRDSGGADDGARYWLNSHIELLLDERRHEQALAAADDYARRFDHLVPNPMDAPWRSHKARALDRLGHREEALELVHDELQRARAWGAPGTVCRTLRTLGMIEREDGLGHLEESVAMVTGSPARLEEAKSLAALGAALRRARRHAEAREPLRRAFDLAAACGADSLVEHVRTELRASGARPRTTALSGVGSLTASEQRVAALAADGQTNREVAEALFVTPKTVEMHLANIYRKLGVRSRRELPAALGR